MMAFTKDEAKEFFADTYARFVESWQEAWRLHVTQINHPYITPSCRAHIMQNLAFGLAFDAMAKASIDVRKIEVSNHQLLVFRDTVIVGFKKLNNESFMPNAYPTRRKAAFYRQMPLPEIGDTPRIVCGLKVSEGWTEIIGCYLVHPKSTREHNWVLNLSTGCSDIDLEQEKIEFQDDEQFFTAPAASRRRSEQA